MANLKKKLGVFFPELTAKDYRFLMNNKKDLSMEDIEELLLDNDVSNFDPIAEAFKAFDPNGEGFLDTTKLREIFIIYGFGDLNDEELEILKRVCHCRSIISTHINTSFYKSLKLHHLS